MQPSFEKIRPSVSIFLEEFVHEQKGKSDIFLFANLVSEKKRIVFLGEKKILKLGRYHRHVVRIVHLHGL